MQRTSSLSPQSLAMRSSRRVKARARGSSVVAIVILDSSRGVCPAASIAGHDCGGGSVGLRASGVLIAMPRDALIVGALRPVAMALHPVGRFAPDAPAFAVVRHGRCHR